ncbi:MAG: TIGR04282 family arsenosugar biosynthesis glycosyltransferase [Beijerinckiaceae bacterium]
MTRIAIFTRAPVPGASKTRLIPALGAEGAARLHVAMTEHAIRQALAAGIGPVELWCAPDASHPFFAQVARDFGVALHVQAAGELGEKMLAAFAAAKGPLLLTGSDVPSIMAADIAACADALEQGADAVFLPAEDGGYGLVGAARPIAEIFAGIEWGGARVMEQTREKLMGLGLAWREPRVVWDVDLPEDYDRLRREALLGARLPMAGAED